MGGEKRREVRRAAAGGHPRNGKVDCGSSFILPHAMCLGCTLSAPALHLLGMHHDWLGLLVARHVPHLLEQHLCVPAMRGGTVGWSRERRNTQKPARSFRASCRQAGRAVSQATPALACNCPQNGSHAAHMNLK